MAEMTVRIEGEVPVLTSTGVLQVSEYRGDASLHVAGAVANVVAGQAICTLPAPPAGFYRVDVHRIAGGSGSPTLFNNGQFRVGATIHTLMSAAVLELPYTFTFYVALNGSTDLSVNAAANGAANITIAASITATRIK